MADDTDESGESKKPDLRFTRRVDQGVSIERDMSGTGHLSRGSHTNMSRIKMSVQAKSRDYLDPELAALHEPAASRKESPVPERLVAASDARPPAQDPVATAQAEAAAPSLFGRIANAIRRITNGS